MMRYVENKSLVVSYAYCLPCNVFNWKLFENYFTQLINKESNKSNVYLPDSHKHNKLNESTM